MTSLTKKTKTKTEKFCFIANQKTHQVFQGFEQLSTTIDWSCKNLAYMGKLYLSK